MHLDYGFVKLDYGFVKLDYGFVKLGYGFVILDYEFVNLDYGFVKLDYGFVKLDFGFVKLEFGFVKLEFGFVILGYGFVKLDLDYECLDLTDSLGSKSMKKEEMPKFTMGDQSKPPKGIAASKKLPAKEPQQQKRRFPIKCRSNNFLYLCLNTWLPNVQFYKISIWQEIKCH